MKHEIKLIADNLKEYEVVYIYAEKADRTSSMIVYQGEHDKNSTLWISYEGSLSMNNKFRSILVAGMYGGGEDDPEVKKPNQSASLSS